jgi:predicted RecB family nuclease
MLPSDFQFSQSNLQDYVDCPRRFELRYLKRLNWPAAEAAPMREQEDHMQRGATFHRLAHQHLVGIDADVLSASINDEGVRGWWEAYLKSGLDGLPEQRYPEITLSAPLAGQRIVAKYDLIAIEPGQRAIIVDWKTSLHRPKRENLEKRLQTTVYRYMLALAGAHLNGGQPIEPEQVEMIYWFAGYPDEPERFSYSAAQFQADAEYLRLLAEDVKARETFALTDDERRCKYCSYRSLCRRGVQAGNFVEMEGDLEDETYVSDFSFDQIGEIAF